MDIKLKNKKRRSFRVRKKIKSMAKLRISVFRSNRHLYVQLINDVKGITLAHVSTLLPEVKAMMFGKFNKGAGKILGELFFKKCSEFINFGMVFDRGPYSYAGVISEFVSTIRVLGVKV